MAKADVLEKLKNVRATGPGKWQACCPAHDDKTPSLSVTEKADGTVLLCCHAGCAQKDIISALSLQPRDLFPAKNNGHPVRRGPKVYPSVEAAAQEVARRAKGVVEATYKYTDIYYRVRVKTAAGKTFRPIRAADDGWALSDPPGLLPLYGADQLGDGVVYVCEGEKATDAARNIGLTATTSGSSSSAHKADWTPLACRQVVVLPDYDEPGEKYATAVVHELHKLRPRAECRIVRLPDSTEPGDDIYDFIARRRADGIGDAQIRNEIEQLAAAAPVTTEQVSEGDMEGPPVRCYRATPQGLVYMKPTRDGDVPVPLTNFTAQIVAQVVLDDGVEQQRQIEIEAKLPGKTWRFTIPASQLATMNWPLTNMGVQAIVYPGFSTKDQARAAIQMLSSNPAVRTVYTHLGWRKVGDGWVYLHAGGAVGPNGPVLGIDTAAPAGLDKYVLPAPPTGDELVAAIRASLRLLDLAPPAVMFPLFSAIWRAVLGHAPFSVHLAGATGVFKSEVAALAQQHFGAEMNAKNLPAAWSSTGNALEATAFAAKDAVLVVDDFAPAGSSNDVQRYHREADRLLRAQGNRSGRQRMRADATLRAVKPPRGMILSTGEDVPRGHSIRARTIVLEITAGDVDPERLTAAQADAVGALYALALAGYIRWLAPRYGEVLKSLPGEVAALRVKATQANQHRRTPEIVADLLVGLRYFLKFAVEVGAITADKDHELRERAWAAMGAAAAAQTAQHQAADPVRRFLELLTAALASGHAHVAGMEGGEPDQPQAWGWRQFTVGTGEYQRDEWRPQGDRVGWIDKDSLFLEPEAVYRVVQAMAAGEPLPVNSKTLHKRLAERGLLASADSQRSRNTVRITAETQRRYVLHLRASCLTSEESAQSAQSNHTPPPDAPNAESGPISGSDSGRGSPESNQQIGPLAAPERRIGSIGSIGSIPETCEAQPAHGVVAGDAAPAAACGDGQRRREVL
ncbi:MAG: DUF927 domain-containing protein [Phycisphaerae bacterium]|nr:DUF927 domain-containing protein [Phycisphaerae bacterium]